MRLKQRQRTIEKDFNALADRARFWVLKEIARLCKKEKLTFSHVFKYQLYKTGHEPAHTMDPNHIDEHQIWGMIHWYEDFFGLIDLCLCVNGEWQEGQTPLIQFKKPY